MAEGKAQLIPSEVIRELLGPLALNAPREEIYTGPTFRDPEAQAAEVALRQQQVDEAFKWGTLHQNIANLLADRATRPRTVVRGRLRSHAKSDKPRGLEELSPGAQDAIMSLLNGTFFHRSRPDQLESIQRTGFNRNYINPASFGEPAGFSLTTDPIAVPNYGPALRVLLDLRPSDYLLPFTWEGSRDLQDAYLQAARSFKPQLTTHHWPSTAGLGNYMHNNPPQTISELASMITRFTTERERAGNVWSMIPHYVRNIGEFNSQLTNNLLERGYKGIFYAPNRSSLHEREVRILDPATIFPRDIIPEDKIRALRRLSARKDELYDLISRELGPLQHSSNLAVFGGLPLPPRRDMTVIDRGPDEVPVLRSLTLKDMIRRMHMTPEEQAQELKELKGKSPVNFTLEYALRQHELQKRKRSD